MPLRAALRAVGDAAELVVSPVGLVADEVPSQRAGLAETAHRPWPLPARPWLMGQTWYSLLFAHWAVRPEALRPLIPQPLELDLRDGQAWLGVTPFVVGGLRLRGTPPLPWLSRFPELNVRTYVDYGAHPGIYFFSLDAARLAAVAAARRAYRLPYFHAEMSARRGRERFTTRASGSTRAGLRPNCGRATALRAPRSRSMMGRSSGGCAERYRLYVVDERGRALRADIHHPPWPLQPAGATIELNTMARPLGLDLVSDPLLHYSARQDTLIWPLEAA